MRKRIWTMAFSLLLALTLAVAIFADGYAPRLVDEAGLLTESEGEEILLMLDEISLACGVDVVIYTVDLVTDESAMDQSDGTFEANRYGMGEDRSCVLLYINVASRDWYVTTAGYGITAVTDTGLTYLSDQFAPHLSEGDYAEAFRLYAQQCRYLIEKARGGDPYDADDLPKAPFNPVLNLIVCLVIGFIGGLIIVGKEKAKLKTVNGRTEAEDYTVAGSMAVTDSREIFLYKTVSRTAKSTDTQSSTHTTKSGTRVGGGGGKF